MEPPDIAGLEPKMGRPQGETSGAFFADVSTLGLDKPQSEQFRFFARGS